MRKLLLFSLLALGLMAIPVKAGTGFYGSPHDLLNGPASCQLCHVANSNTQLITVKVFTPYTYSSDTIEARVGQPSPVSALCLSCHDGTIASGIGPFLKDDHPISFNYYESKRDIRPTTLPLYDGKLECSTCHDVHNLTAQAPKLLRLSNMGSGLCLNCHEK